MQVLKVQRGLKKRAIVSFRAENRECGEEKSVGVCEGLDRLDGHRVAARSKAQLCGRSLDEIVGSNPTGVSLVNVVCS